MDAATSGTHAKSLVLNLTGTSTDQFVQFCVDNGVLEEGGTLDLKAQTGSIFKTTLPTERQLKKLLKISQIFKAKYPSAWYKRDLPYAQMHKRKIAGQFVYYLRETFPGAVEIQFSIIAVKGNQLLHSRMIPRNKTVWPAMRQEIQEYVLNRGPKTSKFYGLTELEFECTKRLFKFYFDEKQCPRNYFQKKESR